MANFEGRVVILTGATGGFGRAAARFFHDAGATLVLSDLDADALAALAGEIGGDNVIVAGDICDPDLSEKLVEAAQSRFGRLDIAVNNAGIAHDMARLPKTPLKVARQIIDVDLMGVFYAMRAQLPALEHRFRETGETGAIVNVASVAGVVAAPMLAVYAAAKHGVVGLTKSAAIEYARRGVRINALCPSFARTPMVSEFLDKAGGDAEAAEAGLVRAIPMGRLAEVDEVIAGLAFLADPASSFVTGQTLQIDGGLSAA
ncbi:SDR family oxidoreductase [Hoeflea sp. G2-23]|uniref:SDR family oxidoreductase n=1 Tax=Hoeflea algicola TaxID=2983763 RepID=A0ABT3Z587_9HYPH|nr:SDR family oxidoreductase [Hoeflea algicola]MCY0146934.1 SDR family oxidoreductase [Hoeflea algicola]